LSLQVSTLLNPRTVHDEKQLARSVGILLRSLRKRRGFSQSQLAMRAAGCVARTYLSKAECGHVLLPLSKLLPIAKALGLTAVILRFETITSLAAQQSNDRR
jgi:transcriptional regulator with XRE-family HTH domain